MDIKGQIEELVSKIKNDSGLLEKFKNNPEGVIKNLIPGTMDDAIIEKIIAGVKAKLAGDAVSGAMGSLGKMFGKE